MKKLILYILAIIIPTFLIMGNALAADVNVNDLVPKPGTTQSTDLIAVKNLPDINTQGFFVTSIKFILSGAMLLTIIALVVASIYYIMSRGEEEAISKAKNIILYLIIGIAIMAASYGIVAGIVQFEFF